MMNSDKQQQWITIWRVSPTTGWQGQQGLQRSQGWQRRQRRHRYQGWQCWQRQQGEQHRQGRQRYQGWQYWQRQQGEQHRQRRQCWQRRNPQKCQQDQHHQRLLIDWIWQVVFWLANCKTDVYTYLCVYVSVHEMLTLYKPRGDCKQTYIVTIAGLEPTLLPFQDKLPS